MVDLKEFYRSRIINCQIIIVEDELFNDQSKYNNIYTIKQEIAIPRDKLVHDEIKQRMQEKLS